MWTRISFAAALLILGFAQDTCAYSINKSTTTTITRASFLNDFKSKAFLSTALITSISSPSASEAFDGSGSSAYSGKNASTKADLKRSYQKRIIADVKDFNSLGKAIDAGKLDGDAWVNFFIEFQRREADDNGRTYAALVDLVGSKDLSGCGILLASSYAKPGKPTESIPTVKKYNAMAKTFDAIKVAGKKGDATKAKAAWIKASEALSEFLDSVELPSSFADSIYQ